VAARPETLDCADPRHPQGPRLQENIGAADVALTADDLSEITTAAAQIRIEGGRYS
jgi:hypothetical protein